LTSLFAFAHVRLLQAYASIRDREEGQGMTEYAFLVVGIVAVVATVVTLITTGLTNKIGSIFP
jgi:Flp pilus assembly pilin Flp